MNRAGWGKLAVVSFCGLAALAGPDTDPTLRSTTRLVQITVIAQDAQGRPVAGLKRDDFLLFDGRKQREIKVFTVDQGNAKQDSPVQRPPAPGVFTNTGEDRLAAYDRGDGDPA